jgi:hypothetical protein
MDPTKLDRQVQPRILPHAIIVCHILPQHQHLEVPHIVSSSLVTEHTKTAPKLLPKQPNPKSTRWKFRNTLGTDRICENHITWTPRGHNTWTRCVGSSRESPHVKPCRHIMWAGTCSQ